MQHFYYMKEICTVFPQILYDLKDLKNHHFMKDSMLNHQTR